MIAIDWSHTKDLTTYDGKKLRLESKVALLKRIKAGVGGESAWVFKSTEPIHPLALILEQGCPLSLIYSLMKAGRQVYLISNRATQDYRVEYGIGKSDENDAKIIYQLANNGTKLQCISLDDKSFQMHDLYHQYCRYQKARVAMMNMRKGHKRQFGDSDLSPYDIAIGTLKDREKDLLKKLESLSGGGESKTPFQSMTAFQPPPIRGLGKRIWLGLMVTANPSNFKNLSSYQNFCGLRETAIEGHKYSRHARMLYHMLAEEVMRLRDPEFRPVYDKCKVDIAEKHPDYTKLHIHNGALNRTATFLAKRIFQHCKNGEG